MKLPQPDISYLDTPVTQEELDIIHQRFVLEGRPFTLSVDGGPIFVVEMTMDNSRDIIIANPDIRARRMKYGEGSEYWKSLGLDRSFAGWAHLIRGMRNPYFKNSLQTPENQ